MKSVRSLKIIEVGITVLQSIIFVIFLMLQLVWCDALSGFSYNYCFTFIRKYIPINSNMAGIFLQVDATILTLTIALVALISGLLADSHVGISDSDFFLNIRPRIYRQIVIICLSLFYFGIGCIFFWLKWNYLVVAVLLCEILLVTMSVVSIYGIFNGKDVIRQEIEAYSLRTQLNLKSFGTGHYKGDASGNSSKFSHNINSRKGKAKNKAKDAQEKFIVSFNDVIIRGDKNEYDVYLNLFLKMTDYVWRSRNAEDEVYDWETYRKNCCRLLDACAESQEYKSKLLYLRFISELYDHLFLLVQEEKGTKKHTSSVRHSFGIVEFYSFCNDIIRKISITEFESNIRLSELLFKMNVIDLVLYRDYGGDKEAKKNENYERCEDCKEEKWIPDSTIKSIQSAMGQYILEQQAKGNFPNLSYWAEAFNSWYGIDNIDYLEECDKKCLSEAVANGGALYTCGMFTHAQFDIVKKGLYERRLASLLDYKYYEARTILAIHAYLYYMAYRENEEVVGAELVKMVKSFLADSEVMQTYREFLTEHDIVNEILIDNLRSKWHLEKNLNGEDDKGNGRRVPDEKSRMINILLRGGDLRLGGRGMQILIMSDVIDDFCLFTLLFLDYHSLSDLDWIGDDNHNIDDFIPYITTGNDIEARVKSFVEFMNIDILKDEKKGSDRRKKYEHQAEALCEKLQETIKAKYKEKRIKEAREKEAEYLKKHDLIEKNRIGWMKDIYQDIHKRFGNMFCPYIPSNNVNVQFSKFELFNYTTYTNMINDKFDHTDLERIAARIADIFVMLMKNKGCVIVKDRQKDFVDDHDYTNFLTREKLEVMVGSNLLLKNRDYRMTEYFEETTKNYTWINTYGGFYAAAIKKGSVVLYIRNLEAIIRDITLDDEYIDTTKDEYNYEPIMNVSLPFEREELSEYLKNERKRVEVVAEIGIQVYDSDAGIYFESERKPIIY